MKHFLGNFCNLLVHQFWIFNPDLVACFVKITRNDQKPNIVSTPLIYKTLLWGKKETKNFWPVINYMQWLILYSYQNDDVLNEWQLLRWKQKCWNSSRLNWTKNKKWIASAQNQSHTYLRRDSRHWWKEAKVILSRVFLSTTASYMIITNTLKTIKLEEQ